MQKIVTAQEMARIEHLAYEHGASDLQFMENAGLMIAEEIENYIAEHQLAKKVLIVIGKGNNGGDALVVGQRLIKEGFTCIVWQLFPDEACSDLCQKQLTDYRRAKGEIKLYDPNDTVLPDVSVILDGLLGTGFHGKTEGLIFDVIEHINGSKIPILSVDVPSGVNATTGEVLGNAVMATRTIYLGLAKVGFFIGDGWNYVGELVAADFGMEEPILAQAKAIGILMSEESTGALLPPLVRNRHKYQAGYVLAIGGSRTMPGAILLSGRAALHSGAGIVRLFCPFDVSMPNAPDELIIEGWDLKDKSRIVEESKRAKAALIGPGIGRTKEAEKMVKLLFSSLALPTVIDADALFWLSENPRWTLPKQSILTPHHQEMRRLLKNKDAEGIDFLKLCENYAREKGVTLVLKGAPTWIFFPDEESIVIPRGDPGMATAGAGDVLTGMIAALLAQGLNCEEAAALGVYLHALAGESAAFEKTSYCMSAGDLIEHLPDSFFHLISQTM
jgi:ADP-dependent NAD(P)H-hydrate dehydratase / NAD(P)H-hydrate epimerase